MKSWEFAVFAFKGKRKLKWSALSSSGMYSPDWDGFVGLFRAEGTDSRDAKKKAIEAAKKAKGQELLKRILS